jgi:hypothetical protein
MSKMFVGSLGGYHKLAWASWKISLIPRQGRQLLGKARPIFDHEAMNGFLAIDHVSKMVRATGLAECAACAG